MKASSYIYPMYGFLQGVNGLRARHVVPLPSEASRKVRLYHHQHSLLPSLSTWVVKGKRVYV